MVDNNNDIKIVEITNHEDGSATVTVECSQETYNTVFDFGFVALLRKGIETDADG
jgi:hypothetical protein